ncbi:MAG: GIY-YIG nuclease family protein [Ignavibacteria bacterium]|nr:GIY-YIG nuclease family protein [Ignavibacteria bacterium]
MPYYTYIIRSKIKERFYIGSSDNLQRRLILHNEGRSISTKAYIPWELVYFEKYDNKTDALKREKQLKKMKSKKYIEWLISNHSGGRPACPDKIGD